jgi:hypothetical protein
MAPGRINAMKGAFLFEKHNFSVNVNTVKTCQKKTEAV